MDYNQQQHPMDYNQQQQHPPMDYNQQQQQFVGNNYMQQNQPMYLNAVATPSVMLSPTPVQQNIQLSSLSAQPLSPKVPVKATAIATAVAAESIEVPCPNWLTLLPTEQLLVVEREFLYHPCCNKPTCCGDYYANNIAVSNLRLIFCQTRNSVICNEEDPRQTLYHESSYARSDICTVETTDLSLRLKSLLGLAPILFTIGLALLIVGIIIKFQTFILSGAIILAASILFGVYVLFIKYCKPIEIFLKVKLWKANISHSIVLQPDQAMRVKGALISAFPASPNVNDFPYV